MHMSIISIEKHTVEMSELYLTSTDDSKENKKLSSDKNFKSIL